jgi:hypothetical protein
VRECAHVRAGTWRVRLMCCAYHVMRVVNARACACVDARAGQGVCAVACCVCARAPDECGAGCVLARRGACGRGRRLGARRTSGLASRFICTLRACGCALVLAVVARGPNWFLNWLVLKKKEVKYQATTHLNMHSREYKVVLTRKRPSGSPRTTAGTSNCDTQF